MSEQCDAQALPLAFAQPALYAKAVPATSCVNHVKPLSLSRDAQVTGLERTESCGGHAFCQHRLSLDQGMLSTKLDGCDESGLKRNYHMTHDSMSS